jgi:glycosyltransferase involved in cell wall biosynthesis
MKVSGFTIIRNALKYDFPVVQSIQSILPLCDEVIVSVGNSEDNTLELIKSIQSPKIKIVESVWDDSLRKGGLLLAKETNKAFDAVSADSDWLIYIQADEVLHEKDIPVIKASMQKWKDNKNVEGLLLEYMHFYASYSLLEDSRLWYRREIRIVRNDKHIRSYRDAQGFRMYDSLTPTGEELLKGGQKLKVKHSGASIYHYGWVKHPVVQQEKRTTFYKLWHEKDTVEKNLTESPEYDYSVVCALKKFDGTHPAVMQDRIKKQNWEFDFDTYKKNLSVRESIVRFIETKTGWRPGEYKNYKLI